jgi:hypothetical protein
MAQTKAQLRQAVRRNLREVERFRTALTGTFTVVAASAAVTGASSLASDELQAGDELQLDDEIRQVIQADSATAVKVNTPFLSAHAGVTGYVLSRRTWTDEEVDEAVNGALADLHTLLLADAPAALLTRVTGNLATSKTATMPTTLATVETVEVLGQAGTDVWTQLRGPLPLVALQPSGPLPWWYTQTSFTAAPTAYGWVSPASIEMNSTPPVAITNGMRWTGAAALVALSADTDVVAWPDAATWEGPLVKLATGELLMRSRTTADRASFYLASGEKDYHNLVRRWARGRQQGPWGVQLVR